MEDPDDIYTFRALHIEQHVTADAVTPFLTLSRGFDWHLGKA